MKNHRTGGFSSAMTGLIIGAVLAGCSSSPPPPDSGFLSDYSRLQRESDNTLRYAVPDELLAQYSAFIIEPVQVHIYADAEGEMVPLEAREELAIYMRGAMVEALHGAYDVVAASGPGVGTIRIALTNVDKATLAGALPQGRLLGFGAGGASIEAELLDSRTGEQIGALIESQLANRLNLPAGWSKWGDAKAVMNDWAKRFRRRLDEAHGR